MTVLGRIHAVLLTIVLALGVGALDAAAATSTARLVSGSATLTLSPNKTFPGRTVTAKGRVTPAISRYVTLQRYAAGRWNRVKSAYSGRYGYYTITFAAPHTPGTTQRYRLYAPAKTSGRTTYRALVSPTRLLGVGNPTLWRSLVPSPVNTCGIRVDGSGWCWGYNDSGQVGDGTTTNRTTPFRLPGSWRSLTMGFITTCGVRTDDSLWCWGENSQGQVGDGTRTDQTTPHRVPGSWRSVVTGFNHTCAVATDDSGWCWGGGYSGQLGVEGVPSSQATPVQLPYRWRTLYANGGDSTCGTAVDGDSYCWGRNNRGQVGDGTTGGFAPSPRRVPGHWATLGAASDTRCGITQSGGGLCWGSNDAGTVGNGSRDDTADPDLLTGLWSSITGTSNVSRCGTRPDGSAWCWGSNGSGQVGDGTTADRLLPTRVQGGPASWRSVALNSVAACGVGTDASGWCWGYNGTGQVGDGSTTDRSLPVQLPGTWRSFATTGTGGQHSCGIRTNGTGWCWGQNALGQLGDGTTTDRLVPTRVP